MSVTDGGILFAISSENGHPKLGGIMDPRQGAIDRHNRCQTCSGDINECTGHFGHIDLCQPVYHIGFFKTITKVLRCVCFYCSKMLVSSTSERVKEIVFKTEGKQRRRLFIMNDLCKKKRYCEGGSEINLGHLEKIDGKGRSMESAHTGCGQKQPRIKRKGLELFVQFEEGNETISKCPKYQLNIGSVHPLTK